jgi:hypothetical protein
MGFLTAAGMAAVVVLGTAVPASAAVGDVFTVDNIEYTITSEDDATAAATDYSGSGGSVDIPDSVENGTTYTVTYIGGGAFFDKSLLSVTIGDSVTSIGPSAFAQNSLSSVTIGDSVKSIGDSAFDRNSLTSVTIPNSVISIGDVAFSENELTAVTIPNSVISIGGAAFHLNALESVTIGDSVKSIGGVAFGYNSLTAVTIPNSVTSIGAYAFVDNSLSSVTIPNSVTSIGGGAFTFNSLTSVTIGDSVKSIGDDAFYNNSLSSVTIPNSVTSIGDSAFYNNPSFESVIFAGPAPTLAGSSALGDPTVVKVYYYTEYGADVMADGFTTPTWEGYATTAWVVSLDLGLNVGDPVTDAPVELTAEGLLADSGYTVVVRSTPNTIASGTASNTGTVSDSSGRMPSGLAAGPHTVTFTGTDANGVAITRVAYLTVSDTGTVTYLSYTAAESPTLAETGFEVAPFGAAALLLLAAGVALTLRRRRVTA